MNEWLWIAPLLYFLISAMGNSAAKKAKDKKKGKSEKILCWIGIASRNVKSSNILVNIGNIIRNNTTNERFGPLVLF